MHYGWTKDARDDRDHHFESGTAHAPLLVDLAASAFEPPVTNQLKLQSCSAHALAAALQFVRAKEGLPAVTPSRLFIYYNERVIEGTVDRDCGAQIRNGIKSVARQGICAEELWPYDPPRFAHAPPAPAYHAALPHRALSYSRIARSVRDLKACLAQGYPFIFGMSIFPNFVSPETTKTGVVTMPGARDPILGGHAVVGVGYDDQSGTFKVRNSLGAHWGAAGYFTVPYAFMESAHCSDDFWTVRTAG